MGRSFEAGAVADPQEVGRGVVPVAGQRILARHRLLVGEQQRLVARVEMRALKLRHRLRVDPARRHEVERVADPVGQRLVAFRPRAATHEVERPAMDLLEVGITALREGAQQVERRRGLVVAADHPLRIGAARVLVEGDVVDVVAAIAGQRDAALFFGGRRARLGELAGHAAELHHRQLRGIGQHHRHLQDDAEGVANVVRVEFGEALGAIAALQQKSLAGSDLGQLGRQRARLAGEDERRETRNLLFGRG